MGRLGYGSLGVEQFVAFHSTLSTGAWAAVPGEAGPQKHVASLSGVGFFKVLLRTRLDELIAARVDTRDIAGADALWDAAQRRFVLTVQLKVLDENADVRADAEAVQAVLCPGGSTAMTQLEASAEVTWARSQLQLASSKSVAARVKRLGLRPLLDDIAARTDELERAIQESRTEGTVSSRSRRLIRALSACAAAFNHVHEGLTMLHDLEAQEPERARLKELREPFETLLAQRPIELDDDGEDETTKGEGEKPVTK